MQSNKEIGKISQTTPFVIAKSLELFLEDLADSTARLAKQRSEVKVTPTLMYPLFRMIFLFSENNLTLLMQKVNNRRKPEIPFLEVFRSRIFSAEQTRGQKA